MPRITSDPKDPVTWWKVSDARPLFGHEYLRNSQIQTARDRTLCTCKHRNVSHGYGYDPSTAEWRDGSRIGMGECGFSECACAAFQFTDQRGVHE